MSSLLDDFPRVSKDRPCPVCGRGDWCLLATDGRAAICCRVESDHQWCDAGWYHRLGRGRRPRPAARRSCCRRRRRSRRRTR